jgi:DNA polymerase III sliding clamp (beta) subunit (PCNA family)
MSTFTNKNQVLSSTEGNVLTIKTVQIAPFRTLMTALKDILLETNITFEPDGMRIINMDKSHTILVHLFLAAQNFEFYECKKDKIIIGVNMFHLFKLISTIQNDEPLRIYFVK